MKERQIYSKKRPPENSGNETQGQDEKNPRFGHEYIITKELTKDNQPLG